MINPIAIECGDILIEKHPENMAIVAATNCEYTHAILCDNYPTAYEADGYGVTEISLNIKIYNSPDDVILLRAKNFSDKIRLSVQLIAFPKSLFGTNYGTLEARRMKDTRPDVAVSPNRQICTRLVCQAYNTVNVKLVENIDYPLIKELMDSDKLFRVNNFLLEATSDDLNVVNDGASELDNFPFFLDSIFSYARELYKEDIQNIPQLVQVAYKYAKKNEFREKDVEMESYMREKGFFVSIEEVIKSNPHLYDFNESMKYTEKVFGDLGEEKLMSKRLVLATINAEKINRELRMMENDELGLGSYCREVDSPLLQSLYNHTCQRIELNHRRLDVKRQVLKYYKLD